MNITESLHRRTGVNLRTITGLSLVGGLCKSDTIILGSQSRNSLPNQRQIRVWHLSPLTLTFCRSDLEIVLQEENRAYKALQRENQILS